MECLAQGRALLANSADCGVAEQRGLLFLSASEAQRMRMVRTVGATFAGLMLVQSVAFAQAATAPAAASKGRDAWYWGITGGAMVFDGGFDTAEMVTAPMVGAEWFVMRDRFAVRLSVAQSFFETQASVFDPTVPGAARPVDVQDWRRYAVEVYATPRGDAFITPYGGAGLALNVLQDVVPVGSFVSEESLESVFLDVDRFSTRASLMFAAGAQFNFGRTAFFVEGNAMPTQHRFLLDRSAYTLGVEAGIRYTWGSAIERF
jgi:hypothetical protein